MPEQETSKEPASNLILFLLQGALDCLMIFSVLSVLFWLLVSKLEISTMQGELDNIINSNVKTVLTSADTSTDNSVKNYIQSNPEQARYIYRLFNVKDPVMSMNNDWLYRLNIIIVIVSVMAFLLAVVLISVAANKKIPFKSILIEKFIIIAFVGIAEFVVFNFLASKYIAIKPSTVATTAVSRARSNLLN